MNINPSHLEINFDKAGVRNSQKRLKELISELAVEQLKDHQDDLVHQYTMVEAIMRKRVANVIAYWAEHKDNPIVPDSEDLMKDITNASKNSMTLEEFYVDRVKDSMYTIAPLFAIEMPEVYTVDTEDLEYALLELEERFNQKQAELEAEAAEKVQTLEAELVEEDEEVLETEAVVEEKKPAFSFFKPEKKEEVQAKPAPQRKQEREQERVFSLDMIPDTSNHGVEIDTMKEVNFASLAAIAEESPAAQVVEAESSEKALAIAKDKAPKKVEQEIQVNTVLDLTAEAAWGLVYGVIGFNSEYIQGQMLPRWRANPDAFERDRRFLYQIYMDTIRNAAGGKMIAGNYVFADRPVSVDQLWNFYYSDLAKNMGSFLTQAKLEASVNDPWWKKLFASINVELRKISPIWLIALTIALIFDALTTYVSLDQTPMEGPIVMVFTVLITALFQIADMLVISYRKREFEADALVAKYQAVFAKLSKTIETLDTTSDSFVQLSMEKSQASADIKAAEDSRKMSRRGGFWSARIADINIIVTAYGFAFMFLNANEPMYALFEQINIIIAGQWQLLNLWVFLMIAMAITVSFVINTAQRTEVLGWTLRRMKNGQ